MAYIDDVREQRRRWAAEDLIFGKGTLDNAKPVPAEFVVAPVAATAKVGCAWLTIATVAIGVVLWGIVMLGVVGGG